MKRHQTPHRFLRHRDRRAGGTAQPIEEMLDEKRNVFLPLSKRRQVYGNDIEPVVQVLAELPFGYHPDEIAVGGGNHAHVHLDRV